MFLYDYICDVVVHMCCPVFQCVCVLLAFALFLCCNMCVFVAVLCVCVVIYVART